MKNIIISILTILSFAAGAQNQIVISTSVTPPFPATTDEMLTFLDQSLITLQNTSPTTSYNIKLSVSLRGNNGLVVETKPEAQPPMSIALGPGETRIFSGVELRMMYDNFAEDDFNFQGITAEELLRDPTIPDGSYQLCVQAFDYNTSQPLSLSSPVGCTPPFLVIAVDPPIIVSPTDESVITPQVPQGFNINWIPVNISNPNLRYRLKMIDITDFDQNIYDALDSDNFLFYSEDDIIPNSIFYGSDKPLLDSGHTYALRVEAYSLTGEINVKNQGRSDVVTFTYGEVPDQTQAMDEPDEPTASFNCNEGCDVDLSGVDQLPGGNFTNGDTVRIGNFDLYFTNVTKAASNQYSGEGVILPTSFLAPGVAVDIVGIKVNSDGIVIEGKATAKKREGTWMQDSWKELQGVIDPTEFGESPADIFTNLTSQQFYIDQMQAVQLSQATKVPVGYSSGPVKIEIVGMNFEPTRASINLFSMMKLDDDQDGEKYLSFGQKNVCISPDGLANSEETSVLYLASEVDYKYSDDLSIKLLKGDGSGDYGSGTYMEFDCEGFQEVAVKGILVFSPEVFVAVKEDGKPSPQDTVAATLTTTFTDWNDWIATVDFNTLPNDTEKKGLKPGKRFQYKELEDYVFALNTAVFDHSILLNDPSIVFPDDYNGTHNGQDSWEGLYVKNLQIELPRFIEPSNNPSERIKTNVDDLLIDEMGLSGKFLATQVLNRDEGTIGDWMFSVDSLKIHISQNSLLEGRMVGAMQLPVTDSVLDYIADIEFVGNQTTHTYFFETNETFDIPMWYVDFQLNPNSTIDMNIVNSDVNIEAKLHGLVSFGETIDGIPGINLKNIEFQDFIIRNKKNPKYLSLGSFGMNKNVSTPEFAGFSVSLNEFGIADKQLTELNIGMGINFTGEENEFSGATAFTILNDVNFSSAPYNYSFEGARVDSINLSADVGAVAVSGVINFYRDDPDFGKGFEGAISATFLDEISVSANCLFGNKPAGNKNTKYWYVYGQAAFPAAPVPFITPIDLYGFGGGAYYNLKSKGLPDASNLSSVPSPRSMYEVSPGGLGLKATVVFGMTPEPKTFNGDVTLEVAINTQTWGINNVSLNGTGVVMSDLGKREKVPFSAVVGMNYDFGNKILDAQLDMDLRVPYDDPVATGGGNIHLYREPGKWWFKAGVPDDRISATVSLGGLSIDAGVYFMMGDELPAATIPIEISNFLNGYTPVLTNSVAVSTGTGFAAGARVDVNADNIDLIVCYMDITAIAGFDISVMDYNNCICSGRSDFGMNKWYANGQGYLYGDISLKMFDTEVFASKLGAIVEGGFPNPTGVKGIVKAEFSFFGKDFSVDQSASFGTICEMELGVDANGDPILQPSPVEGLTLIKSVYPNNGTNEVDVMVEPIIEWGVETNTPFELSFNDGQGNMITERYRFLRTEQWQKVTSGGNSHYYKTYYNSSDKKTTFAATTSNQQNKRMLDPDTQYKIIAKVRVQVQKNGIWQDYVIVEGDNAGEVLEVEHINHFTTGEAPLYIDSDWVDFSKPYDRQRFYTYGDLDNGLLKFNIELKPIFDQYEEDGYDVFVRYTPINPGGASQDVQINLDYELKCFYEIPTLAPQTTYKLEVVAKRTLTAGDIAAANQSATTTTYSPTGRKTQSSSSGGFQALSLGTAITNVYSYSQSTYTMLYNPNRVVDIDVKKVYTLYFRTSRYASMAAKVSSIELESATVHQNIAPSYGTYALHDFSRYHRVTLSFTSGEGFDVFDIFGHPYQASGSFTSRTVRMYDSYATRDDLPFSHWYRRLSYNVYQESVGGSSAGYGGGGFGGGFGQAGQVANQIRMIRSSMYYTGSMFRHKKKFTLLRGYDYEYILPPLSDEECGLALPSGTGSSNSSTGPVRDPYGSMPLNIQPNISLKVYYDGDLAAKRTYEMISVPPASNYFSSRPYPDMTSDLYIFKISSGVMSNDGQQIPSHTKVFNVNLTIP